MLESVDGVKGARREWPSDLERASNALDSACGEELLFP